MGVEASPAPPEWLKLLGPIPEAEGRLERGPETSDRAEPGDRIRLVLGHRSTRLRIVTARFSLEGTILAVQDLILHHGGNVQESARATMDPRISSNLGTHWVSEGSHHRPRALKDTEHAALLNLAGALLQRARAGPDHGTPSVP